MNMKTPHNGGARYINAFRQLHSTSLNAKTLKKLISPGEFYRAELPDMPHTKDRSEPVRILNPAVVAAESTPIGQS